MFIHILLNINDVIFYCFRVDPKYIFHKVRTLKVLLNSFFLRSLTRLTKVFLFQRTYHVGFIAHRTSERFYRLEDKLPKPKYIKQIFCNPRSRTLHILPVKRTWYQWATTAIYTYTYWILRARLYITWCDVNGRTCMYNPTLN